MAKSKPIEKIQTIVNFAGYPTQLQPLAPDSHAFHLLVGPGYYMSSRGVYDKSRFTIVDIAFLNDVLKFNGVEPNPKADYLQFIIELPFSIPQNKETDAYQLLSFFNLLVPMGTFCIHSNGTPFFRFSHLIHGQEVEALVVMEALNTMMFFVETLGYKIEELATGAKTLYTILSEKINFDNRPENKKIGKS